MKQPMRVLLADDHTILREATAEVIDHQADMAVVGQAGSGEEALALARATRPDVVVMDAAMPRTDGLQATRRILAEFPQVRVLVLSAHQDAAHVLPLLEAGATGYLPKTASLDDLLEAIRTTGRGESVLPPSIASVVVQHMSSRDRVTTESELSERELEVLRLVALGLKNEEIGRRLHLSPRTVEAHLTHIYTKLDVGSRTEAALVAERKGWLAE